MSAERRLVLFLRVVGGVACLALVAVFMPREWMAAIHERVGLGRFPDAPIAEYLARSLSAMYAFLGGLLLLASQDVHARGWVITYVGLANLACGPLIMLLDARLRMPIWWTAAEGTVLTLLGVALIVLRARVKAAARP